VDITPDIATGRQIIQRYGDGRFVISGRAFSCPVLVRPERTVEWAAGTADLAGAASSLALLLSAGEGIELVVLGCGPRAAPVPPALRQTLRERGIGIEPMDTGAACRTYKVLMAEGRQVAAALLPVD